jgi:hypothetical protein
MNQEYQEKLELENAIEKAKEEAKKQRDIKRKKKLINSIVLPNEIVPIPNADKTFYEKWGKNSKSCCDFPHSFVMICSGIRNSGKSTVIKNIILHQSPEFERIVLVHCDPETKEYDDMSAEIITQIPAPSEFDPSMKNLLIIDDMEYKQMDKDQKRNLDRLCGYASSHRSVSVIATAQDAYSLPVCVRRNCDIFVLWRGRDLNALSGLAKRTGMTKKSFLELFKLCKKRHDSICIDLTKDSPMPLRFNLFNKIEEKNN